MCVTRQQKWSDFLFDFDISELADALSAEVVPYGYADDVALWYEAKFDHIITTIVINQDLQPLRFRPIQFFSHPD